MGVHPGSIYGINNRFFLSASTGFSCRNSAAVTSVFSKIIPLQTQGQCWTCSKAGKNSETMSKYFILIPDIKIG